MIKRWAISLMFISLGATSIIAQSGNANPPVSTVFAVLTKSVDSKSAVAGQELNLRTVNDVLVDGKVVIPKGARLLGHVTEARTKGKGEPQSALSVTIDKAVRKDGTEIPVQAIIAAVAAPQNSSLSADPVYGMTHSLEPNMAGGGAAATTSRGELSSRSKAASTAAVTTADIKGVMDQPLLLNEKSQGALGYEGLSLSWQLTTPPPVTTFATKGNGVKLQAGTQVLLRMVPPRMGK